MANLGLFENGTAGLADGTALTDLNPGTVDDLPAAGVDAISDPVQLHARVVSGYRRNGSFPIEIVGATANRWQLAPDVGGAPGTWGAWGATLTLDGPITTTNTPFWIRARVLSSEIVTSSTDDTSAGLRLPDDVVGVVGRSWALPYQVASAGSVSRSWALPYLIMGSVGKSWALPYTILNQIGRSWALPYQVSGAVSKSWALPYSILAPTVTEYGTTTANPEFCCMGPDGNVWYVTVTATGKVGKMTPGGTITEYSVVSGFVGTGICSDGTDLFIIGYDSLSQYGIWKVTTGGTVTRILTDAIGYGGNDIAVGSDGNLWSTAPFYGSGGAVRKISKTGTGETFYSFSDSGASPQYLVSDGTNLWVTLYGVQKVAKVTTGGTITTYSTPTANPYRLCYHAAQGKVYVAQSGTKIVPVTPSTGAMGGEITGAAPAFLCEGPDGQLWVGTAAAVIRRVNVVTGSVTSYSTTGQVWGVVGDLANSRLFYASYSTAKIGKVVL